MKVAFRVEGGRTIGMGHVMRCLALARVLAGRGHEVTFLCSRETARALRNQWRGAHCVIMAVGLPELCDAARCKAWLSKMRMDWLVVDHYQLGYAFESVLRDVIFVLSIDDLARIHNANIVLDTALGADKRYRNRLKSGRGLFGPRYALLRSGIIKARRLFAETSRIFVSFGGADPHDMTQRTAKLLAGVCEEVDFVVGYPYQQKETLTALCKTQPGWRLYVNSAAPEMLMAQSVLALGAGGTMTWERLAVGVPSVVVSIADNQVSMSELLGNNGLIHYMGSAEQVSDGVLVAKVKALLGDEPERLRLRACGRQLVDGLGAVRVAHAMERELYHV